METYYTLLDVPIDAPQVDIEAAYRRQREQYNPERLTALGEDFQRIATVRTADLDRAYTVLSDPRRRHDYDVSIGLAPRTQADVVARRAGLSRRELALAIGGALMGLLVIAVVWVLSGQRVRQNITPVGEVRRPAPELALPSLEGGTVRLSDYHGKVVLVNFWGTWCQPCKEETPALQRAYQKLRDQGLVIIGVDLRNQERAGADGDADVRKFVESYSVTYPIALDTTGDVARAYQILPIPTSYFVDQSGTIRYIAVSKITEADVEAIFNRLKREAAAVAAAGS